MDSGTTTTTTTPANSPERHQWSFRRFGADVEGQATLDTWDSIYRHGPGLVKEIDRRMGDLYEAEAKVMGPVNTSVTGMPNKVKMRTLQQHVRSVTREIRTDYLVGGTEEDDGMVHLRMPVEKWKRFQELTEQMDQLVKVLASKVSSSAEAVRNTQRSLKKIDTDIKEFIAMVMEFNRKRMAAFPPFYTELGSLHASLYGLGCMTTNTTTTTKTGAKQAKKRADNNDDDV